MSHRALDLGQPDIFNADQGVQFTAQVFTSRPERAGIRISMDGRGRALDNVFIERLWRSVKYEHVYLYEYTTVPELEKGYRNTSPPTTTSVRTRACHTKSLRMSMLAEWSAQF